MVMIGAPAGTAYTLYNPAYVNAQQYTGKLVVIQSVILAVDDMPEFLCW